MKYESAHAIGETVSFKETEIAESTLGIITAIRFTKAKVFYDIVDYYHGILVERVDSAFVTKGE